MKITFGQMNVRMDRIYAQATARIKHVDHLYLMDKNDVVRLHASFENMLRKAPETEIEFWLARDLQMSLGYAR